MKYIVSQKREDTRTLVISSLNIDQFKKNRLCRHSLANLQ